MKIVIELSQEEFNKHQYRQLAFIEENLRDALKEFDKKEGYINKNRVALRIS